MLYSQRDSRWTNVIYSAKAPHTETIKSSGCGITCAASVLSELAGLDITPPDMAKYSVDNGYRIDGVGTANALFPAIAKEYGLSCIETKSQIAAEICLAHGGIAVCGTSGGVNRIFSTGGHFFLLVGSEGDKYKFFDPDCYTGKYRQYGREKYVELRDGFVYVNKTVAAAEINRYFCFEKEEFQMFSDVKETDYAYKHIAALKKAGIINGDDQGLFNPAGVLTRRDAAVMIANALRYAGILKMEG